MTAEFPARPYLGRAVTMPLPIGDGRFVLLPPYVHGRSRAAQVPEALPSINEFLDDVPPISQFAPTGDASPERQADWPSWGGEAPSISPPVTDQWARDDWQGYDWGSAANLGTAAPDPAAQAWASTDWGESRGTQQSRQSAAEALAHALDQISRRIRTGELRVPGSETVRDDAAVAATLAALLGIRR